MRLLFLAVAVALPVAAVQTPTQEAVTVADLGKLLAVYQTQPQGYPTASMPLMPSDRSPTNRKSSLPWPGA